MTDTVKVEQVDRELFIHLLGYDVADEFSSIRAGRFDSHSKMQKIARFRLAHTKPEQASEETWSSIAAWCDETFGPCAPHRMATRAGEELWELLDETKVSAWTDKAREEAADVLICLSRVPDIWRAVEAKMAINRARRWDRRGDGTGYHIKEALQPHEVRDGR